MKKLIITLFFLVTLQESQFINQAYATGNVAESDLKGINENYPVSETIIEEQTPIAQLAKLIETSSKNDPSGFLTSSASKDEIFKLYHKAADSFQYLSTEEKPWDIPLPEFYDLAKAFVDKTEFEPYIESNKNYTLPKSLLKKQRDYEEIRNNATNKAIFFLENSKKTNIITYRWFLKFSGLCTAINTIGLENKNITPDTSNYESYQQLLMNAFVQSDYNPQIYFNAIDEIGSPITHEYGSLNGVTTLFPEIVILPYPYDLDDKDIFLNFPNKQKHVWFAGFANDDVIADGSKNNPHHFFYHDILHLSTLRYSLTSNNFMLPHANLYKYSKEFSYEPIEKKQKNRVHLFFKALELNQSFLDEFLKNPDHDEDTKKIYGFFSFLIFHEYSSSLRRRLHRFNCKDNFLATLEVSLSFIKDPYYYGPLLPKKILQELQSNNLSSLETHAINFHKNLHSYVKTHHANLLNALQVDTQSFGQYLNMDFLPNEKLDNFEGFNNWNPSIYHTEYLENIVKKTFTQEELLYGTDAYEDFYEHLSWIDPDNKIPSTLALFYNFQGNPFKTDWKPIIASIDVFTHKDRIFDESKEEIAQQFKNDLPHRQDGHSIPIMRYYGYDWVPIVK